MNSGESEPRFSDLCCKHLKQPALQDATLCFQPSLSPPTNTMQLDHIHPLPFPPTLSLSSTSSSLSPVSVAGMHTDTGPSTGVCVTYQSHNPIENWLSLPQQPSTVISYSKGRSLLKPLFPFHAGVLSALILLVHVLILLNRINKLMEFIKMSLIMGGHESF